MKKEITEESLLAGIYRNVKMGADAILNLLPSVKDAALRSLMTQQLDGYEKYAAQAERALHERGCKAKEEGAVVRLSAKMGVAIHVMIDSGVTHIAEIMIESTNMGVTDLTKQIHRFKETDACSSALRLAREAVRFEERNLEVLKGYL